MALLLLSDCTTSPPGRHTCSKLLEKCQERLMPTALSQEQSYKSFPQPAIRTLFFFFHLKQTYDFICDEKSKHLFLATRGLMDNFDSEHTGDFPLPCFLCSASVITSSVCWARLHLAQDFIRNRKSYLNYKCMGFITESIT